MNHLLVYSHPNPKSFNHAILEELAKQLQHLGQQVHIRDLYAENFDPVLQGKELVGYEKGHIPDDIQQEQDHVRWADVIVFIPPIWWGGFTSILRGYLDRVFSNGFAYEEGPNGIKGLLSDKKVFTINTIGAPENVYQESGLFDCMNKILDEIVFQFCDAKVIGHKYFSFVVACSEEERKAMLSELSAIAKFISRV